MCLLLYVSLYVNFEFTFRTFENSLAIDQIVDVPGMSCDDVKLLTAFTLDSFET